MVIRNVVLRGFLTRLAKTMDKKAIPLFDQVRKTHNNCISSQNSVYRKGGALKWRRIAFTILIGKNRFLSKVRKIKESIRAIAALIWYYISDLVTAIAIFALVLLSMLFFPCWGLMPQLLLDVSRLRKKLKNFFLNA